MGVEVKSLYVYPIKSCGGISVAEAPICSTGFRWDRQWVVVNSKGKAYTQRVEPKLALVQTQLPHEAFSLNYQPNSHSFLEIKAPGMQVLKVPLVKSNSSAENVVDGISVWEWNGSAFDEGAAAAQWFSNYLGSPARLVRFNHVSGVRKVEADYAPGYNVMFADMYPFLLLSQGSMDALNARLKESVPVNRFRPNIVVDGCEAFSEDGWREMKINKATFKGVKLCSRCKIPTINQETGKAASSEPTDTLRAFRSDKALRPNNSNKGKVYFGQNMVCTDSLATKPGNGKTVKVGDALNVLQITASPAA
ncbi:mitochondrial amidoxime-reducing component 1-like isoform X1 [Salvia splendens]|uniref:mitochondrial amidoxime-reducing component 1-like isoform X1 n=1 Tax=Salvia splendens TaxID=180675 RepID=UPI001C269573|nr:mitochondrial amidoxime-reducing component 1-like isoform X1 [Salvia splendens]